MADKDQVVGIDATISLIEQLGKAFLELKAHKDAAEDNVQWSEIEEYFQHLETMMKKKIEELALREKDFKEKESETCTLLAEREAAVASKEQDLLDRIQELKDAAVAAIAEARAKHEPEPLEPIDGGDGKETKVSGRQIDAVHFIHAFELTERFPAVPLLKTYLKDLRRNSQGKPSNSGGAAGAQNDANSQELAALRAVIRCVKEYKLGADYPLDPLQKRVTQLERSKPDKKRSGESGKHQQFKKPRNGGFHGFRSPASAPVPAPTGGGGRQGAPAVFAERAMYAAGIAERYPPHAVPSTYDYQTPSQPTYAQQPPYDQRSYYYTQDDRVSAASTYNAAPPSYGSYVGSGMQSSHQQYM